MKVQFGICFQCAQRMEVFSSARTDAPEMRSHANPRTRSKTSVRGWRAALIRTHHRTCSNGCDTVRRSLPGSKDAGLRQEPEVFRAHNIETRMKEQAWLR